MTPSSEHRQTILISFSGIDGAGKSTQIANLCAHLHAARLRVEIVTFWDDVATLKHLREDAGHRIFKGDRGVGSPDAPINRRDKNVRSPLMTLVRLGIYFLDALALRTIAKKALDCGADVVIFDRYLYDELANLNVRNALLRPFVRALKELVPQPDVSFVLDADPEQARARKPEYPLAFLRENRNAYLALSDFLGGITVVPPLPLEQAKAEVLRNVFGVPPTRNGEPPRTDQRAIEETAAHQKEMDGQSARPIAS